MNDEKFHRGGTNPRFFTSYIYKQIIFSYEIPETSGDNINISDLLLRACLGSVARIYGFCRFGGLLYK